ncbi:hypothetical protein YC2023_057171 [Brassica napus]
MKKLLKRLMDTYNNTCCYNHRSCLFKLTSNKIVVEGAISRISTFGGPQDHN